MWRSSGLRLGARLCCPRGGARAPAERGHRSLVSCIDRKAPPGEQVSGARAGAVVSAPAERAVAPGGRRRGPPRTAPPAACHPWRSPRPIHLGGPRADLALSDLRQPVAPLGLACYLSRTPPHPPTPSSSGRHGGGAGSEPCGPGLTVPEPRPFRRPPHRLEQRFSTGMSKTCRTRTA